MPHELHADTAGTRQVVDAKLVHGRGKGHEMADVFSPRTYRIPIEGIANNFYLHPHFRAFIETDSNSPTVTMTTNHVSEAQKVDFWSAAGGTRTDDGRTGILVYMRWSDTPRMGDAVTVTLWQAGATRYGLAEPLPEEGFDPHNPTAVLEEGIVELHAV